MPTLTFLGTSDAFNGGGRGHSCYWIEDRLGTFTVDFGPTALQQVWRTGHTPDAIDGIYVTHLHGDHIGGLAILLIDQQYRGRRTRPLTIAGPPGLRARVQKLRESAYPQTLIAPLPFEVRFVEWAVPGTAVVLGRAVQTIRAKHDEFAIAASLTIQVDGVTIAFSGDTGWQGSLAELVEGAQIFVCECSAVEAGFDSHLSVAELAEHRAKILVDRLILSHLSLASREAASAVADQREWTVADDGLVIDIAQIG